MGLKKGVEKTLSTVVEVIQKVKDAVLQTFGNDVVPKHCFVSSEVRHKYIYYLEQELLSCLTMLVLEYSKSFKCANSNEYTVR